MTPASDVDLRDDASTAGSSLPQPLRAMWRTIYWTYERATWQYDLMVVAHAPPGSCQRAYLRNSHTPSPDAVGSRSQSGGVSQMNARMTITRTS